MTNTTTNTTNNTAKKPYVYFPGDKDTMPKTAGKANSSAIITVGMALFAFWGYGEPPNSVVLTEALTELAMSIIAGLISWVVTYYKANYVKDINKV